MRDGLSNTAPQIAPARPRVLAMGLAMAVVGLGGCGGRAKPSDEAVNAYLDRSGHAPLAVNGSGAPDDRPGATTRADEAPVARRIALTVESGRGLPDMDAGPGVTDPYVILEYEGQRQRTTVIEGSLDPIWGDTFIFDVTPAGVMVFKLMDEDTFGSDDHIGTVSMPLPTLRVGESIPLEVAFRKGEGGYVMMTLTGMARP